MIHDFIRAKNGMQIEEIFVEIQSLENDILSERSNQ